MVQKHITQISSNDDHSKDLSGPALRTFYKISELWKLSSVQQMKLLGGVPKSTFFKWKKGDYGKLSHDTLERISYIIGIYKSLQILLPNTNSADNWIKKKNFAPLFNGQPALDRMLSGNVSDLYIVRQYLDAQRGGWS